MNKYLTAAIGIGIGLAAYKLYSSRTKPKPALPPPEAYAIPN